MENSQKVISGMMEREKEELKSESNPTTTSIDEEALIKYYDDFVIGPTPKPKTKSNKVAIAEPKKGLTKREMKKERKSKAAAAAAADDDRKTLTKRDKKKESKSKASSSAKNNKDNISASASAVGKQQLDTNTKPPVNMLTHRCIGEDLYMEVRDDDDDFWDDEKYDQKTIEDSAWWYRRREFYGRENEERTCIWSGGDSFKWSQRTSGIPWVGVNGTDATLVVAMATEEKTLPGWTQLPSGVFILVPLCDMGVYADTTTASTKFRRELIALNSPKSVGPFAVVSVPPGTTEDHLEVNRDKAVEFLEKKLQGRSALIYKEIEQIAICALKVLLGLNFDSNMIQARFSGKAEGPRSRQFSEVVVQKHLAAINQT